LYKIREHHQETNGSGISGAAFGGEDNRGKVAAKTSTCEPKYRMMGALGGQ
jgi:hypothetical protein